MPDRLRRNSASAEPWSPANPPACRIRPRSGQLRLASRSSGVYLDDVSARYIEQRYHAPVIWRCVDVSPKMRREGAGVMSSQRASVLELAVLGLLHENPLHGYELRKRLNSVLGAFRAFSYGSLYPCLKELLRQGLIAEEV